VLVLLVHLSACGENGGCEPLGPIGCEQNTDGVNYDVVDVLDP
jgi:hypothetical protein